MRKKWTLFIIGLFLIYALAMYVYLFHGANTAIPDTLKGTSADPTTFMSKELIEKSESYSKIRNFFFFISTPLEWLFYAIVLVSGLSKGIEKWGKQTWKRRTVQISAYVFWLSLLLFIFFFCLIIVFELSDSGCV